MIEGRNKARPGSIYCGRLRNASKEIEIETQQERERGKFSDRKIALNFFLFLTISSLSLVPREVVKNVFYGQADTPFSHTHTLRSALL